MEEQEYQWPSRASTVTHIPAEHLKLIGVPVYSSWACWELGILICVPAALPLSHHGANLVHSLCVRGQVIDRWQLNCEFSSFRLLQHKWRCSKQLLHWKDGSRDVILVLPGSSQHRRNEPNIVSSVFHWHLETRLSWRCEESAHECWSPELLTSVRGFIQHYDELKALIGGAGKRVLKAAAVTVQWRLRSSSEIKQT